MQGEDELFFMHVFMAVWLIIALSVLSADAYLVWLFINVPCVLFHNYDFKSTV